ncbi:MAG: hypothetical protein HYW49_03815 [Deltaproteobacteria bacterium]|nr:hypothetical protein [Deltaproteobacteria bacterium]
MGRTVRWLLISALLIPSAFAANAFAEEGISSACDPGIAVSAGDRASLVERLQSTTVGKELVADFKAKYGSLDQLNVQWDLISYSQVLYPPKNRVPAGEKNGSRKNAAPAKKTTVCIHLTRKLPEIEHIADFAHELTHAARLDRAVLTSSYASPDEFVAARIGSTGGEADAFATECRVKHELLGEWDSLCAPYASSDGMDHDRIVGALYDGTLSASLTGEPYPVMLAKQFRKINR